MLGPGQSATRRLVNLNRAATVHHAYCVIFEQLSKPFVGEKCRKISVTPHHGQLTEKIHEFEQRDLLLDSDNFTDRNDAFKNRRRWSEGCPG